MIARIAPSAIWRPKLAETVWTLESASKARSSALGQVPRLLRGELLGLDLEAGYFAADRLAAADDLRALLAELRRLGADVLERDRLPASVDVIFVPPSKSIPRLRPLIPIASDEITSTTRRSRTRSRACRRSRAGSTPAARPRRPSASGCRTT